MERRGRPLQAENAFFLERLPYCYDFGLVDKQQGNRHSTDLCQRFQFGAVPDEVFRPGIAPGMEQANDLATIGINAGNVRAF